MENVNMWVKHLPLGDDQESWAMHSPNVTVAQRCRLFDQNEYRRGITNFEKLLDSGTQEYRCLNKNKYVQPRKTVEKKRIFECLMLYFKEETANRDSCAEDLHSLIENLTTPLAKEQHEQCEEQNALDDPDLDTIFNEMNDIAHTSNECNSHEDTTTLDDTEVDDIDDPSESNGTSLKLTHHKYVNVDVLKHGVIEMEKKNYIVTRMCKMQRMKRNNDFIHCLFNKHKDRETYISNELSWFTNISNNNLTNDCSSTPMYTLSYRNFQK